MLLGLPGRTVIVALCGAFDKDEVLNAAIEFTGDGIGALPIDERLMIANITTEWGALVQYILMLQGRRTRVSRQTNLDRQMGTMDFPNGLSAMSLDPG